MLKIILRLLSSPVILGITILVTISVISFVITLISELFTHKKDSQPDITEDNSK